MAWEPEGVGFPVGEQCWAQRLQPDFGRKSDPGSAHAALDEGWKVGQVPSGSLKAGALRGCLVYADYQNNPKEGLPLALFERKFLLVRYNHVLLQQIIKHMWLVGSTMGLFILTGCFLQCFGSELC